VSGLRQGRKGLGGSSSVDGIEEDGVSGGGVDADSVIGAFGSEAEVVEAVNAVGRDDGAFEGDCDDRSRRVSGRDTPVYFAE